MEETKVIYYIDEEETPYMMKIPRSPSTVTLADFKAQLNRTYKKFFFKSMDDDIGVVKEEIAEDDAILPNTNGRVVCWVVLGDGSASGSDVGNKGDLDSLRGKDFDEASMLSGVTRGSARHGGTGRRRHSHQHHHHRRHHKHSVTKIMGASSHADLDSASDINSITDADATSFCETDDTASRISVETTSTITSLKPRRKVLTKTRPKVPRSMSMSTMTTSSMSDASMQVLSVVLNMEAYNFLGISIVGQTNEDGIGGIYVGTIMKGGAVAADGRIEPGDMLLQVNSISFENMSNDDAVRTLREIVQQPGPITLTVAKCMETEPYTPVFEPRMEPIRPMDPSLWVMQTNAQRGEYQLGYRPFTGSPTLSTMTSNSSPSLASSIPESERDLVKLSITTPMYRVAKAMAAKDSGLEVKDRMWLKMTIPNSFIGSELVDWAHHNMEGFIDRRHARKYAALMLKHGFIRHTVNKITFSEQCYYVFGDFKAAAHSLPSELSANLRLSDHSGGDTDTLGPLPGIGAGPGGWSSSDDQLSLPPYDAHQYLPHPTAIPVHMGSSASPEMNHSGRSGRGSARGSSHGSGHGSGHNSGHGSGHGSGPGSGGGSSASSSASSHTQSQPVAIDGVSTSNGNSNNNGMGGVVPHPTHHQLNPRMRHSSSLSTASEFTSVSQQHIPRPGHQYADRMSLRSFQGGTLGDDDLLRSTSGSRASFQQALDNPCEYFIDVM